MAIKSGKIYMASNGQLVCSSCAGFTASSTGRDIDGNRLVMMGRGDGEIFERMTGKKPSCQCGNVHA